MKIILYPRRNVGLYCLSHLIALGHRVSVITDDKNVEWLAGVYGCKTVDFDTMGEFDLFACIHGNKIIDKKYLIEGKFINVHPCLYKYKGHNPIKRYILNEDEEGSVEVQYMIEEVDAGEVIHREDFYTGRVNTFEVFYNIALPYYFKAIDRAFEKLGI